MIAPWLPRLRLRRRGATWLRNRRIALYQKTGGALPLPCPSRLSFPLTTLCNRRCPFCEMTGMERHLARQRLPYHANPLTPSHLEGFAPFLRRARVIDLGGLSGVGEPLLSPDFEALVTALRCHNPAGLLAITTNGELLDRERADFLLRHPPLHLTVSLPAASEKLYTQLGGREFTRLLARLEYFCDRSRNRGDIATSINFGVGKHNREETEEIVRLAHRLGIGQVYFHHYYCSPNLFPDDHSLYAQPHLANASLLQAYQLAKEWGQALSPPEPPLLPLSPPVPSAPSSENSPGCREPLRNLILKAYPFLPARSALGMCNRLAPFEVDWNRPVTASDLAWAWRHPLLQAMRIPSRRAPSICRFCRHPGTPALRSLEQPEYQRRRDQAIRATLAPFQGQPDHSPSGAIRLVDRNLFSLPFPEKAITS